MCLLTSQHGSRGFQKVTLQLLDYDFYSDVQTFHKKVRGQKQRNNHSLELTSHRCEFYPGTLASYYSPKTCLHMAEWHCLSCPPV